MAPSPDKTAESGACTWRRGEQWREAKTVSALVLLLPPTFVPDGRRQREEISEERSQNPYLNFRKTHLRQAFFSFFFFLQTEFLEFPRQREEISEENPPEPISELPKNPSQARSDLVLHLPPTSVPDGRRQREEISEERSQNPLPSFRKTHLRSSLLSTLPSASFWPGSSWITSSFV
ncbi:uncharacterized protein LOC122076262 [Macadamia integrifolia]|uniref:uncharacterized protein LOC122076262 n=1 Tax=Macadamia integrifolia TaxID=60698 RepID=UPI001C4FE0FA|nr:uncharacterized protein LOC122076262 [Macadamia integrifolia]